MNKLLTLVIALLYFSMANANPIAKVSIYGKYMGVKPEDFKAVNSAIGTLITEFKVKKFEILATGIEGGFTACVEPNQHVDAYVLWWDLNLVSVDTKETSYSVEMTDTCK